MNQVCLMSKRALALLVMCLIAGTAAQAQTGGGGGHGGRGGGGGRSSQPSTSASTADSAPRPPATPLSDIEIIGVITAIDKGAGRVTIAYQPVEALNWPAGAMPFVVSKDALLKDASVGEKVRFKLQSQQITELRPF